MLGTTDTNRCKVGDYEGRRRGGPLASLGGRGDGGRCQLFLASLNKRIGWIEFRHPRVPAGDPAEHINLFGIGERVADRVHHDLQQEVSSEVFIIVNVRLDHHAVDPINLFRLTFMKGQLDVCFPKLNLLPTACGAGLEKPGVDLWRELPLQSGKLNLLDNFGIRPTQKPVWREGVIPNHFFDVIERRAHGKVDGAHGRRQIEEGGERGGLIFHELRVAVLSGIIIRSPVGPKRGKAGIIQRFQNMPQIVNSTFSLTPQPAAYPAGAEQLFDHHDFLTGEFLRPTASTDFFTHEIIKVRAGLDFFTSEIVQTHAGLDFLSSENVQTYAEKALGPTMSKLHFLPVGNLVRKFSYFSYR